MGRQIMAWGLRLRRYRAKNTVITQCRPTSRHFLLKTLTSLQPETMKTMSVLPFLLLLLLQSGNILLTTAITPGDESKCTWHFDLTYSWIPLDLLKLNQLRWFRNGFRFHSSRLWTNRVLNTDEPHMIWRKYRLPRTQGVVTVSRGIAIYIIGQTCNFKITKEQDLEI